MKKFRTILLWSSAAALATLFCLPGIASAGAHLTLGGSSTISNAGYQKIESGAASGGLAFDLGEYFRLGYTYRQELAITSGYIEAKDDNGVVIKDAAGDTTYEKFLNKSRVVSQSVDLTIVLYAGDIFTPYIFAGIVNKSYDIENQTEGEPVEHTRLSFPSPNGGAGMGIRLNQKFTLKLSHTISQGVKQLPGQKAEGTLDTYSQIGISYSL